MAVRHLLLLSAVLLLVSSAVYALSEEAQLSTAPKATIQQKKVAAAGVHVGKNGKKYQTDSEGFPILSFPRDEVTKQVMADIAKEREEAAAKAKEKAEEASTDAAFVESELEDPLSADELKAEAAEKAAEIADAKAEALDAKEQAADADAALKDAAGYVDPAPKAPIQAIGATPTPDTKPAAPAPAPTPAPAPKPEEPKPAPTPAPAPPAEKPKPKRKWFKPVIIAGAVDHTSQQPEPVLPPLPAAPAPCLKGTSLLEVSAQYRQMAHVDADAEAESEADGEDASEGESDADASASTDAASDSEASADADADAEAEESEPLTAESDPKLIFSRRRHKRAPVPEPDRGQFPVEHEHAKQFIDLHALENKGMWDTQTATIENVKGINVGFHNPRTEAQAWAFWKRAPEA